MMYVSVSIPFPIVAFPPTSPHAVTRPILNFQHFLLSHLFHSFIWEINSVFMISRAEAPFSAFHSFSCKGN